MILELLFNLFFNFIGTILDFIPDLKFNVMYDFANVIANVFKYINVIIDIKIVLSLISITFVINNFNFIKNLFLFVIKFIPGVR